MKLLLASSADGYLARGLEDDMKWTGKTDKAIFRLLTLSNDNDVLLAGSRTFDQMPVLPGRRIERLSRGPNGISLAEADARWPSAWLIGGPEVSVAALRLGLVTRAFICVSPTELHDGIHVMELYTLLPKAGPEFSIRMGDTRVLVYTEAQKWPGR